MNQFSELGLSEPLLKALTDMGFVTPSSIQEKSIPILLSNDKDFIGLANTGTGKTAAFGLPLLQAIDTSIDNTQAIILCPTRELGQQIAKQMQEFAKYLSRVKIEVVYGGASIVNQIKAIRSGVHIIVATPGRLIDLLERKVVRLEKIKYFILDEADEMLQMGFKEAIDTILSHTSQDKLTWLFSATMPKEIRQISKMYMNNPVEVSLTVNQTVNANIEHQYSVVKASDKIEALKRIIDNDLEMFGIIFCRTKLDTQHVATELTKDGYHAEALHGDLSQSQRDYVMQKFKAHTLRLLVATDVAARGIDVNDLTHVIHFSLPDDMDYYTHRSGRTARAGKKGISISLITRMDIRKIKFIEQSLKILFHKVKIPGTIQIRKNRITHWASRILDVEIKENLAPEILHQVEALLETITKTELIQKLVTLELDKLGYTSSERDLNDDAIDRDRDRKASSPYEKYPNDRNSRNNRSSYKGENSFDKKYKNDNSSYRNNDTEREYSEKRKAYEMTNFSINIGQADDMNKGDLLRFICDTTNLRKENIGLLNLQKNVSHFEVDKRYVEKVIKCFKGIRFEGRELRVNMESKYK
ncbi:MAG: DEAD/DEAH box helicase [Chitinophagaceae bacterium]|nr:DEAD/DEAH box helicase [Chitinophagaceae bacterium]